MIFSAILAPLPLLAGRLQPRQAVDAINVAALIGGRTFSTITYTFLDGGLRSRPPRYMAAAFVL